jgi:hypothetical protein
MAACALLVSAHAVTSPAAARDLSVGIAAAHGSKKFHSENARLGDLFDHATVYYTLGSSDQVPYTGFDRKYGIIVALKFAHGADRASNLRGVKEGAFDSELRSFAKAVARDGRRVTLRPLPEFNGDWHPWGAYSSGNHPEDFAPAWRHVVTVIRGETDLVRFDLNYFRRSPKGLGTTDFKRFWPGADFVDMAYFS